MYICAPVDKGGTGGDGGIRKLTALSPLRTYVYSWPCESPKVFLFLPSYSLAHFLSPFCHPSIGHFLSLFLHFCFFGCVSHSFCHSRFSHDIFCFGFNYFLLPFQPSPSTPALPPARSKFGTFELFVKPGEVYSTHDFWVFYFFIYNTVAL